MNQAVDTNSNADESPHSAMRRMTPLGLLASPTMLTASRQRLGWMAATILALTLVQRVMMHVLPSGHSRPLQFGVDGPTLSELGLVLDLGLILLVRLPRVSAETVLRFGFVYEVLRAFTLSLSPAPSPDPPLLSWAALIAITFPLVLPQLGMWSHVASLLAAATQPLGMLALSLSRPVAGELLVKSCVVSAFSAVVAVFSAELIRRIRYDEPRHAGSYNLVKRIGRGGMGEVWKAEHRYLLRPAAIKLIPQSATGGAGKKAKTLRRFRREAQVTALLTSPHTVQVYDYGVTDTGAYYYVMEYLEGLDLQKLVTNYGPIPPGRAVYLVRQIADSLGEAHHNGLIHRDIKPSNLMIVQAGQQYDFVKVLDFGLVGLFHDGNDAPRLSDITAEGAITGTPAFVAPEMVLGEAIDGRADIYALGGVLYYLVTGRLLFPGLPAAQMALAHVHEHPRPPNEVAPDNVPPDLAELILLCLEKDPRNRPQTARELALRLGSLRSSGTWTQHDAEAWWSAELELAPRSHVKNMVRRSDAPLTE